jgi:hypothetical protein
MFNFRFKSMDMSLVVVWSEDDDEVLLLLPELSNNCRIELTGFEVTTVVDSTTVVERIGSGLIIASELMSRSCGHCEIGFGSEWALTLGVD